MDEHTFRVLEFEKILRMAAAFAITFPGRDIVQQIRPLKQVEDIRQNLEYVSEIRRLLSAGSTLGIEQFDDLSSLIRKIKPADAVLEPAELRSFLPLFYSAFNLKIWSNNTSYPGFGEIVSKLITHPEIKMAIEKSIDRESQIRDDASPELALIRKSIKSFEKKIKGILEELLNRKDLTSHLQDFYITQRNNRWVIPVKRDSKGSVPGVVHDISNTGETVFIEPFTIQQISNELESYRAEEKLEMYKILQRLSANIREHLDEIHLDCRIVAEIDALQSIARFADKMEMNAPTISKKGGMKIIKGRHPLLWKALRLQNREKELVPLDIEMGRDNLGMVITGSNAGGKTVTLKTIGVLTLMSLSGMHIPAESGTQVPFLNSVLADIGDEQSIEQNLSTFSAHITRISEIVQNAGDQALVMVDELGTGTDPEQGGALSCAILKRLKKQKALIVVSTHLGILKAFAHSEEGFINSSMEMDEVKVNGIATHRPTYRLVTGEPGTSHALEIAESLGLQGDIIKEAKEFMKGEGARIESLITDLKQKSAVLQNRLSDTEKIKGEIEDLRSSLHNEISNIQAGKRETIAGALRDAEDILRKTRREAGDIIEQLKKSDREGRRRIMKALGKRQEAIRKELDHVTPEKTKSLQEVAEGQMVYINAFGRHGTVLLINEKARSCKLNVDGKEVVIPLAELSEAKQEVVAHPSSSLSGNKKISLHTKIDETDDLITDELNVVGQRVDPALSKIERYLNDASLSGLRQVKIIHGVGTGILSGAVRDYLKDHPLVEGLRKANEKEGGEGVTIVML